MNPRELSIHDFTYQLPIEKIATHPLPQRDASKLLIWKNGQINEDTYSHLANYLPQNGLLILNDTRVIPARVLFTKATGGSVEIFCLEPYDEKEYTMAMKKQGASKWRCMIGGAAKWKSGKLNKAFLMSGEEVVLTVALTEKLADAYVAEFSWMPAVYTFAEIIAVAGLMPLPPYIKRKVEMEDKERYQTIYAQHEGSVAAPTAGLHFTDSLLSSLSSKNITTQFVTLHVGAGTFKPVKSDNMNGHNMHAEWMDVSKNSIETIIANAGNITAVGTTSLRSIESLYWMGVKTILNPSIKVSSLEISQWEVYEEPLKGTLTDVTTSLTGLLKWMEMNELKRILIPTSILIAPGYTFKMINALVTNFHQPQSTLLLLVAALAGDQWRNIYDYALNHEFRFLSYGDGCLLFS